MSRKIILALLPAVLGFALALATTTRPLTSAEATATVGGVCIDDFVCSVVGDCNSYNYAGQGYPTCPHSAGCLTCEFATRQVKNCIGSVGNRCDSHGGGQTDCGEERVGYCPTQAVCSNTVWYGNYCSDGPNCDTQCP